MERGDVKALFKDMRKEKDIVHKGIPWSRAMVCQIHLRESAVPRFSKLGLQLRFINNGEWRDTAYFRGNPPSEPLRCAGADVATLISCLKDRSLNSLRDTIDLAANHAYTPLASVKIAPFRGGLYAIRLMIGSWRGLYRQEPKAFKASLGF